MPKISKTRIINANYNDGRRTIYNEIFDYNKGDSTLFSMDNGIGKSVLIQFFMQPFIKGKRDLSGRKFEDYFTSNTPTYIIHEIIMENSQKLMVGMVIKKDNNSEEEKSKLKILGFTSEYKSTDKNDIINIPFVEGKTILSYAKAEAVIKAAAKRSINFKYYNFSDSYKKTEYFKELESFNIDYQEWENIIKKINNDESGLSELYVKYKTEEALIRGEIVPLIEKKLNRESNQIENIRNSFSAYVKSYKESKGEIEESNILQSFYGDATSTLIELKNLEVKYNDLQNKSKVLGDYYYLGEDEKQNKFKEIKELEAFKEELDTEKINIEYEKLSLEFYEIEKQIEVSNEKFQEVSVKLQNEEAIEKDIEKNEYIQLGAKHYVEIRKLEAKLKGVRERISNYEKEDSEVALNIKNYRFTLKEAYKNSLEKIKEEIESISNTKNKTMQEQKFTQEEIEESDNKLKTKEIEKLGLQHSLKIIKDNENKFKSKYSDFVLERNLFFNTYEDKEIEDYEKDIIKEDKNNKLKLNDNTKSIHDLELKLQNNEKQIDEIGKKRSEKNLVKYDLECKLERFEEKTKAIRNIFITKGLEPKVYEKKEALKALIKTEIEKFEVDLDIHNNKSKEILETLKKLNTGFVTLPKEIEEAFESMGIKYTQGLQYLKNLKVAVEYKEKVLKDNPFMPYALLLSKEDITLLKEENLEVFLSIPIPIINLNTIEKLENISCENQVYTLSNQNFILAFNNLLLDDERLSQEIEKLENALLDLNIEIKDLKGKISVNRKYEILLNEYKYNGNEDVEIISQIEKITNEITSLEKLEAAVKAEIVNIKERSKSLKSENENLEKQIRFIAEKINEFTNLKLSLEAEKEDTEKLSKVKESISFIKNEIESLKNKNKSLSSEINDLGDNLRAKYFEEKECEKSYFIYKDQNAGEIIEGQIDEILERLKVCENELDGNIKRDKEEENSLKSYIESSNKELKRAVKEGNLEAEYTKVSYLEEKYEDLKEKRKVSQATLKFIEKEKKNIEIHGAKLNSDRNNCNRNINKIGFNEACPKESIKNIEFDKRAAKVNEDIKENSNIIVETRKEINEIGSIIIKLEPYKNCCEEDEFKENEKINILKNKTLVFKELENIKVIDNEVAKETSKIRKNISTLHEKYRDKNRNLGERLSDFRNEENLVNVTPKLDSYLTIIDRQIQTLKTNLEHVSKEEELVIERTIRYASNVLEELRPLDKNSSIKHMGKTQKLLKIKIPENKDEIALKEFLKLKVNEYSNEDCDVESKVSLEIKSDELLSKLIGSLSRIDITIMKIEREILIPKKWRDAINQNSGGEKFVSMFVMLGSLMSYMRKREEQFSYKEDTKILIMDNPFAKTTAEHLLKPMFQIAEKYKIQLLCFSGIGGSSVYNSFDKIYVARIKSDKFKNKENLNFNERTESLDEVIEVADFNYIQEQGSLFQ